MIEIKIENFNLLFEKSIILKDLISIIKITNSNIIAATVNAKIVDLNYLINEYSDIVFLRLNDNNTLNILRHSCAHLLAHSLKLLFNNVNISIGPVIKDGFYYDFFCKEKITNSHLPEIEKKMHEIAKKEINIEKIFFSYEKAIIFFSNDKYKLRLIDKIDKNEIITAYKQNSFVDLCKGPHIPNTKFLKYFKLLRVAGAYWEGNSKNEMLYRIYGTIWNTENELNEYINNLEAIKNNDHRKIGKELDLFHFRKEASGVVFWHPKGWKIYISIINYIRKIFEEEGYLEVNTPVKLDRKLFEKSGHIEKFKNNMFEIEHNNVNYILKPMNCPCHIDIFNNSTKSYRNLPLRIAEFGSCYRNEPSGSLYGLMRLKNFTQDDGHIFCSDEQLIDEIQVFIKNLKKVYSKFGFNVFNTILSKRPIVKIGEDKIWDIAESHLETAIKNLELNYEISNDGAFYGPKLEFSLQDNTGKSWQCGTIQIDFFTAKRLNAKYTSKNGKIKNPIILHRAILGSIERFIGILLEVNNGNLPFWLLPEQIIILTINKDSINYAINVFNKLKSVYKTTINFSDEEICSKIKESLFKKIPYIIIIGENESKKNTLSIRIKKNTVIKDISLNDFFEILKGENY